MINFESMNAEQIHESINLKFRIIPDWEMNLEMSDFEIEFIKNIVLSDIESLNQNFINVDDVIKKKNNVTHRINYLFMIACSFSKNPMVVKLLSDYFKIDVREVSIRGPSGAKYNYLIFACIFNHSIRMIKYLVEDCMIDIYHITMSDHLIDFNCFLYSIAYKNYDSLKYLSNVKNMRLTGNNPDIFMKNINFTIFQNDIDHKTDYELENGVMVLINCIDAKYLSYSPTLSLNSIKRIIGLIKNNKKINHILRCFKKQMLLDQDILLLIQFIKTLNPLRLDQDIRTMIDFNINNTSFTDWMRYCVELKDDGIRIQYQEIKNKCNHKKRFLKDITDKCHSNQVSELIHERSINKSQKLFVHNQITYFGYRNLMYGSMQMLSGMEHEMFYDPLIVLEGNEPEYLIRLYIQAGHDEIDSNILDHVEVRDIEHFMRFIDHYPLNNLSISILECDLIKYFEKHRIKYTDLMKDICIRNGLKIMYCKINGIALSVD